MIRGTAVAFEVRKILEDEITEVTQDIIRDFEICSEPLACFE